MVNRMLADGREAAAALGEAKRYLPLVSRTTCSANASRRPR